MEQSPSQDGSLPHSKQPATCPYPKPHRFSPSPHPTSRTSVLILSSHLNLGVPSGPLPSGFSTKTPYATFLSPCMPQVLPIKFFLKYYDTYGNEIVDLRVRKSRTLKLTHSVHLLTFLYISVPHPSQPQSRLYNY
jgi:hypothetical protein